VFVEIKQAQRLQRIPPYPFREINALKNKMISEGVEPIDFGIGDPDMPTPGFVIEALAEAAQDPSTHPYDETGFGIADFKDAVARFAQRRFGVEVSPDGEIQSVIGSKEALVHIIWAYIDPSDVVLVPDPAYSVYKVQTTWCGGAAFPMPLTAANGFLPDLNAIPKSVARAAKMMFLNYPNNPTGAVASLEYLVEAVEFCRKYEIILVNDCAYSEVAYDGLRPASVLEVPGAKDVAIEMHSLSKTFNMTGWRVGWAMGGKPFIEALSRCKSNVDSGTFMAIQKAAIVALDRYEEWVPKLSAEYQARRDTFVAGLNGLGWKLEAPKATFYVWVPVPPGYTSESFATSLLRDCQVLAIPGAVYGEFGEGFVRFSLTIKGKDKQAQINDAIKAMRENLNIAW
jgi:LL-diaminopimelate aminotransferase